MRTGIITPNEFPAIPTGLSLSEQIYALSGKVDEGGKGVPSLYLGQSANRCFPPRNIIPGVDVYAKTQDIIWTTDAGYPNVGWARWRIANNEESWPAGDGTHISQMEFPVGSGKWYYSLQNIVAGNAPILHVTNTTLFVDYPVWVPAGVPVRFRVIQRGNGVVFRQGQIADQAAPNCYLNNGSGTPPDITAAFAGNSSEYSYPPVAYRVMTRKPSVAQFGDSRNETGTEGGRPPYYDNGLELPSIFAAGMGYISFTESATGLNQFLSATNKARRLELARSSCSHALRTWGVNDLNAYGRTVNQFLNDCATFAALLPELIVIGATIAPVTASTDGYTTTAGQTLSANALKVRYANEGIRKGIVGERFYIDTSDAIDPERKGVWPVSRNPYATSRTTACEFIGYIPANSTTLTMSALTSGNLYYGDPIIDSKTGAITSGLSGCTILEQLTGTLGGSAGATFRISRPPVAVQGTSGAPKTFYVGGYGSGDSLHQTTDLSEQVKSVLTPHFAAKVKR